MSCDYADALVAAGIADGGAIPYLVQRSGKLETASGPAYTVEYAPIDDPRPAIKDHYIDSVPSGSIVLIATSKATQRPEFPFTTLTNSLYGGLMSTRAKYLRANGTVVLGSIRDISEQRDLNYPVFSYSVGVCAPNKLAKVVAVNEPLAVPGGTVYPGDFIVADENGVVAVPAALTAKVEDYIPLRVKADSLAAQDIAEGVPAKTAQYKHRAGLPKLS